MHVGFKSDFKTCGVLSERRSLPIETVPTSILAPEFDEEQTNNAGPPEMESCRRWNEQRIPFANPSAMIRQPMQDNHNHRRIRRAHVALGVRKSLPVR